MSNRGCAPSPSISQPGPSSALKAARREKLPGGVLGQLNLKPMGRLPDALCEILLCVDGGEQGAVGVGVGAERRPALR